MIAEPSSLSTGVSRRRKDGDVGATDAAASFAYDEII